MGLILRDYKFKVSGNSFRKEFVYCNCCGRLFVWLKAAQISSGKFVCLCASCRKEF